MIFGIDALPDMGRTSLNVTGDLAVACVVTRTENKIDITQWEDTEKEGRTSLLSRKV